MSVPTPAELRAAVVSDRSMACDLADHPSCDRAWVTGVRLECACPCHGGVREPRRQPAPVQDRAVKVGGLS